jgi:hypothetical protein
MAAGGVDGSIAAMQKAAAEQAQLMQVSMSANAQIQGASTTAQTVNASTTAGTETAKSMSNDIRSAAKAA